MSEHRVGQKLIRQGFVCPECGCVKDGYDPEYGIWVDKRWCWNVRGHESDCRRQMRPTALICYLRSEA